jgi:hypothetical protein
MVRRAMSLPQQSRITDQNIEERTRLVPTLAPRKHVAESRDRDVARQSDAQKAVSESQRHRLRRGVFEQAGARVAILLSTGLTA